MARLGFGPCSELKTLRRDYGLGLDRLGALYSSAFDEPARPDGVVASESWAYHSFDGDNCGSLPERQGLSDLQISVALSHHELP